MEDNMETSSTDQDKVFKKPDKILQCPRCNNLETKFCYFNNYNVQSTSAFLQRTVKGIGLLVNNEKCSCWCWETEEQAHSFSIPGKFLYLLKEFQPPGPSTDNGTVLKFGPDAPLCESMESMFNLRNQQRNVDANSMNCSENGEEEGWNNVASMAGVHPSSLHPATMRWCPAPMVAVPTICPPNIPLQIVPGSYWNGTPLWAAGNGTVSIGSNGCLSPSSSTSNSCCSGNGPPTLGKHPRDTVFTDEQKSEKCVLIPKTLRIDDPNEASKSPIWATLGIKA
ncbi:Zinc finger, Dof-type [Sesbania bispinosa]|nr:Zinc finger, Dof-type [Sesbania bispinosa]